MYHEVRPSGTAAGWSIGVAGRPTHPPAPAQSPRSRPERSRTVSDTGSEPAQGTIRAAIRLTYLLRAGDRTSSTRSASNPRALSQHGGPGLPTDGKGASRQGGGLELAGVSNPGPCYTPPVLTNSGRCRGSWRSAIALAGRIGRPVRRPSDQTMAIRRDIGGATRERSIWLAAPLSGGTFYGAARLAVDAGVGRLRRSLTHLGVRSLAYSPPAFISTALLADSQFAPRSARNP